MAALRPARLHPSTSRPVWDDEAQAWVDPDTGVPLPTWDEALDALDADPDAQPAHVVRFGPQVDAKGIIAGTKDADRTIRLHHQVPHQKPADCHPATTDAQREHLDRLWQQLRVTPCSPTLRELAALRHPARRAPRHGCGPGRCKGKVHQRATLGFGGRRVLVSRHWSGKTLADHRADAKAWVRALLGITTTDQDQEQEQSAPVAWEMARPTDPDVPPLEHRLLRAISARIQQRQELQAARERAAGAGPPPNASATTPGYPIWKEAPSGTTADS